MIDVLAFADQLQEEITGAKEFPPPDVAEMWAEVGRWCAFRDGEADLLKPADWDHDTPGGRDYRLTPLPSRIAGAKSDMVFGEDPTFTADAENDQDALMGIVTANRLTARLQYAERLCASEGQVWWRGYVDRQIDYPLVQWLSQGFVIPLFRGQVLLAAAFVSLLEPPADDAGVWRHVEIQVEGVVRNLLFRTDKSAKGIGDKKQLDEHPDTEGLQDQWNHGLDQLLCGRVLNDEGEDPELGISDYQPVEDIFYALNEIITIGTENANLAGKKRIVVPQRFLNSLGKFPAGAEIIVATEVDTDPDKPGQGIATVELEFSAEALIAWKNDLKDEALMGTRTAPALVGLHTEGAQTGPALRARLIDSVLDAHGKGRYWDAELPECLRALQRLDALSKDEGGLGNDWTNANEPPSVERKSILPEDESEKGLRLGQEVGALLKSRKTAITELHDEWDEDQVDEELARIEAENQLPVLPPTGG